MQQGNEQKTLKPLILIFANGILETVEKVKVSTKIVFSTNRQSVENTVPNTVHKVSKYSESNKKFDLRVMKSLFCR